MRLTSLVVPLAGALLLGLAAGCGERSEPPRGAEPALRGAALVVGAAAEEWSLLSVPRDGGRAAARPLSDPGSEAWSGSTVLPPSAETRALGGGLVVLRSPDGTVYTYDAPSDLLTEIGRVGPAAVWVGGGRAGVFYEPGGKRILQVERSGAWRYELKDPALWAAPVEGGVLALVQAAERPPEAWLLHSGASEPAARGTFPIAPPAVVTAWGRRAVFLDAERAGALRVVSVEPLELAGRYEVDGSISALAASPSSHEILVATDAPPELAAVSRFTGSRRELAALPSSASELRPCVFGGCVLVLTGGEGGAVYRVPVEGGAAAKLDVEWRDDLPIGLPGGRTLGVREGRVVLLESEGEVRATNGTRADSWWVAVRWNPARARLLANRAEGASLSDTIPEGAVGGAKGGEPPVAEGDAGRALVAGPPAGFYAIVGSARQPAGIRSLAESLREAGYPVKLQRVEDDAGRRWHRALVGPFPTRRQAEAAARQLLRERRLQAWVTEIEAAEPASEAGGPDG